MTDSQSTTPNLRIYPDPQLYVSSPHGDRDRLLNIIESTNGGVYGITGVRGAGKTALLKSIADKCNNKGHHTLLISSPVSSSDEMAFFIMLFRQLCISLLGALQKTVYKTSDNLLDTAKKARIRNIFVFVALIVCFTDAILSIYGPFTSYFPIFNLLPKVFLNVLYALVGNISEISPTVHSSISIIVMSGTSFFGIAILIIPLVFFIQQIVKLFRKIRHWKETRLMKKTLELLEFLEFAITRSHSSSVTVPIGTTGFISRLTASKQLTQRSLTLPGLTAEYENYLRYVSDIFLNKKSSQQNRKLIICVDELDKISDSEQVANILREIKGMLSVPNCHYLLTISEDAVQIFWDRIAEERDIIESTFDDIVTIERFDLYRCRDLAVKVDFLAGKTDVKNRLVDLAAVLSSGIPREFIRNLREIEMVSRKSNKLQYKEAWRELFNQRIRDIIKRILGSPATEELHMKIFENLESLLRHDKWNSNDVNNALNCNRKILDDVGESSKVGSDVKRIFTQKDVQISSDLPVWEKWYLELRIYLLMRRLDIDHSKNRVNDTQLSQLLTAYGFLHYSSKLCMREIDALEATVKSLFPVGKK